MRKKVFTLLAAAACGTFPQAVCAQQSESGSPYGEKLLLSTDGASSLRGEVWMNPVMEFYRHNINLNTVELGGARRVDNDAALPQHGGADRYFRFDAGSRLRLTAHSGVLGSAGYEKGRQTGVKWNTQADFDLIYPYVIGTIELSSGENFLDRQQYHFRGAYLHEWGAFTVGAQLKYRAAIVSRDRDPRPRNTVSDARPSLFAAWTTGNYRIGVEAAYRYYLQQSRITWEGTTELARFVYHMVGLGYQFKNVNFDDDVYANYVANGNYSVSLDVAPVNGNGWSGSLGTSHFKYTKELSLSEDVPANRLTTDTYRACLTWAGRYGQFTYGASARGRVENRQGSESEIDVASGRLYLVKAEHDRLKINSLELAGEAYFEQRLNGDGWLRKYSLRPAYTLWHTKPDYPELDNRDRRYMEITNYDISLEASALAHPADRVWLTATLAGGRQLSSRAKIEMGEREEDEWSLGNAHDTAEANFYRLVDPFTHVTASIRADYALQRNQGIYLKAGYGHRSYDSHGKTWNANVTLGWMF